MSIQKSQKNNLHIKKMYANIRALSESKIMKENDKGVKSDKKVLTKSSSRKGKNGDFRSQKEIHKECRLELSMADYGKLMRMAMREGCSLEELVARQIARLAK